jgi:hypothetical protein
VVFLFVELPHEFGEDIADVTDVGDGVVVGHARGPEDADHAAGAAGLAVTGEDEAHVLVGAIAVLIADDDGDAGIVDRGGGNGAAEAAFVYGLEGIEDAVAAIELRLAEQLAHAFDDGLLDGLAGFAQEELDDGGDDDGLDLAERPGTMGIPEA